MLAHCNVPTNSALRIIRLPPRANVPAQHTQRTKAFAAVADDKTAMQYAAFCQITLDTYYYYSCADFFCRIPLVLSQCQCQCQSWIYIAHKRKASNALVR